MAERGPWEDYQPAPSEEDGPWKDFQTAQTPSEDASAPKDPRLAPTSNPILQFNRGVGQAMAGGAVGLLDLARQTPYVGQYLPAPPEKERAFARAPSQSWTQTGGRVLGEVAPFLAAPELRIGAGAASAVPRVAGKMVEGGIYGGAGGATAPTEHGSGGEIAGSAAKGAAAGATLSGLLGWLGQRFFGKQAARTKAADTAREAERTAAAVESPHDALTAAQRAATREPAAMKERVSSAERINEEFARLAEARQPTPQQRFAQSEQRYILQPIGGKVAAEGPEALGQMYEQITSRLNDANSRLRLPYDVVQDFPAWQREFGESIDTPSARKTFNSIFKRLITQKFFDRENLTGRRLSETISSLNKEAENQARGARFAADATQRYQIADSLHEAAERLMERAEGPQAAKDLRDAARTSYGRLMEFQRQADPVTGLSRPERMLRDRMRRGGAGFFRREGELGARDEQLRVATQSIEEQNAAARAARTARAEGAKERIASATERSKSETAAAKEAAKAGVEGAKERARTAKEEAAAAFAATKPKGHGASLSQHGIEAAVAELLSHQLGMGHLGMGPLSLYWLLRGSGALPRLGDLATRAGAVGDRIPPQAYGPLGEEIGRR